MAATYLGRVNPRLRGRCECTPRAVANRPPLVVATEDDPTATTGLLNVAPLRGLLLPNMPAPVPARPPCIAAVLLPAMVRPKLGGLKLGGLVKELVLKEPPSV